MQEVQRVNSLLTVVCSSLTDLGKAVRGLALMSADLDAVGRSLFDGKVPAMWLKKSFPSLKVHCCLCQLAYDLRTDTNCAFSSSKACCAVQHQVTCAAFLQGSEKITHANVLSS